MGFHSNIDTDTFDESNVDQGKQQKKHFKRIRKSIQKRKDNINRMKEQSKEMQEYLKEHPEKIEEVASINGKELIKSLFIIGIYVVLFGLTVKLSEYYPVMKIVSIAMIALGGLFIILYTLGKEYFKHFKNKNKRQD